MSPSYGPTQCILEAPPFVQPACKLLLSDASELCPLNEKLCHSIVSYVSGASAVPSLLGRACPSTVVGRVIFVVVYAIKRVSLCWRFTHIKKKSLKTIAPPVTHGDSPKTVIGIGVVSGVVATVFHQKPRQVFFVPASVRIFFAHAVLEVERRSLISSTLFVKASTGFRVAASQCSPADYAGSSAFTEAVPLCRDKPVHSVNYAQAPKHLTRQVNEFCHFFTSKWFTVMGAWQSAVNRFSGATLAKPLHFNANIAL